MIAEPLADIISCSKGLETAVTRNMSRGMEAYIRPTPSAKRWQSVLPVPLPSILVALNLILHYALRHSWINLPSKIHTRQTIPTGTLPLPLLIGRGTMVGQVGFYRCNSSAPSQVHITNTHSPGEHAQKCLGSLVGGRCRPGLVEEHVPEKIVTY